MIRVLGLALYGPQAASHRVRLGHYITGLSAQNIDLRIHSLLDDEYVRNRFEGRPLNLTSMLTSAWSRLRLLHQAHCFDAAIVHCELFPLFPGWLETALLRVPYIYDFDDAFYLRYRTGGLRRLRPILGNKFERVITEAAAVTAGNTSLASYSRQFNTNTVVLPSVVDTVHYRPSSGHRGEVFTVGWIGSPSTSIYLSLLVDPLSQLATTGPVRFVVVGGSAPRIPNIEVIELPWQAQQEVDLINTFDVGVMPLPDDEWAQGKCAYKLIQYMACGVPVVASNVGANLEVVTSDCGYLAADPDDWIASLARLRDLPELRATMGQAARARIMEHYSLSRNLPLLIDVIHQIV